MSSEERYDDSAFTYFAIAVVGIILIPTTIAYTRMWQKAFTSKYTGICTCLPCRNKAKQLQIESRKPSPLAIFKFIIYLLLWALLFYLLNSAISESKGSEPVQVFDPYQILGLEPGATEDQIRRAYRKLSLKYHPDKNVDDPEAEELFIKIGKAHETLTDIAIRERWEKYGNPDGPQAMSVGIALPSWLIDTKNSSVVLGVYVVFLMIIFPTIAIFYWSSQKATAHNQLSRMTMATFFQMVNQSMRFSKLIPVLCLSYEYITQIKLVRADEPVLQDLKRHLPEDKDKKKKKLPHEIKNSMLFFTHFSRLYDKLSPSLLEDTKILLRQAHRMIMGLIELTASRRWLIPTVEAIQISQMVTQAVWGEGARMKRDTHLLQLPHITEDNLPSFSSKKWKIHNLKVFIEFGEEKRKEFLAEELRLDEGQIRDIEHVIQDLPSDLTVEPVIEVDDDDQEYGVTAGSIATLKLTFSRPSKQFVTSNKEEEVVDVHSPYLPIPKTEIWWVFLADERTNTIIGLQRVNAMRDGAETKIPFQAPPKPATYNLTIFLLCDSYIGFDQKIPLKLKVEKELPTKLREKDDDYEDYYSDEDEDFEEDGEEPSDEED